MSTYTQWINHKGKRILLVNYAGLTDEEEYLRAIDEFEQVVLSQPPGRQVLTLVDVTDSILTNRITERNKEVAEKAKEQGIPDSPTALVGLSGFKLAVAQAMRFFRPDLHITDDVEAAKDWLVAQEGV